MKYFVRAVKYFIFLVCLIVIIMAVLVLAEFVEGNIESMFKNGYDAIWQIALFLAVIAAVYPKVGFGTRKVMIYTSWEDFKKSARALMEANDYVLDSESADCLVFKQRLFIRKIPRYFEDKITITLNPDEEGAERLTDEIPENADQRCCVSVEGLTKDVLRTVSRLAGIQARNNAQ